MDLSTSLKGPLHINIDITNKCNLKCKHCFNRSGDDLIRNELNDKEFINVIYQIVEIRPFSVCICGGEPFMRKDLLFESLDILNQNNVHIGLVTNGLLLDEGTLIKLKELGINSLQISLDGKARSHNHLRNNKEAYSKVINAIKLTEKYDIKVDISFCPTNFNIDEFPELANYLFKSFRNLNAIKIQPLLILGRATKDIEPSELQYSKLVMYLQHFNKVNSKKIIWEDPISFIMTQYYNPKLQISCMDIMSDGNIMLLSYIPYSIGNVKTKSIKKCWDEGIGEVCHYENIRNSISNIFSTDTFSIYLANDNKK